tara:strand:- start:226 stop:570 length:345 start_codon:yes stop_codon:yes gene_type:complete
MKITPQLLQRKDVLVEMFNTDSGSIDVSSIYDGLVFNFEIIDYYTEDEYSDMDPTSTRTITTHHITYINFDMAIIEFTIEDNEVLDAHYILNKEEKKVLTREIEVYLDNNNQDD